MNIDDIDFEYNEAGNAIVTRADVRELKQALLKLLLEAAPENSLIPKILKIFEDVILGHKLRSDQREELTHKIGQAITEYQENMETVLGGGE